ncbi:HD-GYP domain-containing protein [Parahaliea mediterranea]|uniref:HD-GYP domain-containing protein n=1 Tax=Parahaliea mediterranea TaxID=651086 RepID=A0A939DCF3_9GAMM|nr:HD-GYP domain-containing protein [Parahaliea mediterranea]MBN7795658.1 HD-GYP domain-containing protein [Parahaliea mediterranea]
MIEVEKVYTADLKVGMYVSGLDRPWLESPFAMQGFRISSEDELAKLRELCQYVYVDLQKSRATLELAQRKLSQRPRRPIESLFSQRTLKSYRDRAEWADEFPRAREAVQALSEGIEEIFSNVSRGGSLDVLRVRKSVEPMIDSISRNPDACIWLARLKQQDHYTYQHSLGASVWAVALGRQLGLPRSDLRSLAIGGLLFDIGKLRLDQALLRADRPLTEEELVQVRRHVALGVDMVRETGLMNQDVLDMVAHHHERHDGSGYPAGLGGDQIPVFARIAAIVDCYDAITSHRAYARATSPSAAIKMLYEWRDVDFQAELVEEFIQAVGIYPAGSLVELSSGEVAVVIAEYRTRRLRPRVMVLLDADKQPVADMHTLDLKEQTQTAAGEPLDIVGSLEPEAYGIDMTGIQL